MKRIIFVNRYFAPDHSATSQMLSQLAFHLAGSGLDVHVIASQQLYDNRQALLPSREQIRGVQVRRVPSTRFGRSALLGRGIDYLTFYASMRQSILAVVDRGDVVVAKTDPPLISIPAMWAARRRGAKLINWLQDIYPEVAVQLGVPLLKGPLAGTISHIRDRSLKSAVANIVVGEQMAERVKSRGVASDRVQVIPNWCDDEAIQPVAFADNPLRREWGLEDNFVVGYSGNLGRAHEAATVLEAAERLRNHPRIIFLMIGGGHSLGQLAQSVRARGLDRIFRFVSYQDDALLKNSLGVPDVHWISLRPELEGLIVPSKFYGIAAAGRPMIAIMSKAGEISRLIEQHGCGLVIEPGHGDALAKALVDLSSDAEKTSGMGRRARAMLDAQFTRRQAFQKWGELLEHTLDLPSA